MIQYPKLERPNYSRAARPIMPRRRAAAQRALNRERARLPLFADQFDQSVDQRLSDLADCLSQSIARQRRSYAHMLRAVRRVWRSIPAELTSELLQRWETASYPKQASYLLSWLRSQGFCTMRGELSSGKWLLTVEVLPQTASTVAFHVQGRG